MSDAKPYTLEDLDKELSPYGGARGDALAHYMGDLDPSRVLATVEALERGERERDEQLEDSERIIAALVRERDEALERVTMPSGTGYDPEAGTCAYCHGVGACPRCWGRVGYDRLSAEVERVTRERDALKAALRGLERLFYYSDTAGCFSVPANARTMPALHAAREALGEVES